MEPQKDLMMFINYRRMRNIKRCNNFPVINQEDVAQHSFYVALLAMAFADEYNTWAEEHNLDFHPLDYAHQYTLLNTEVVIRKALLHDTEESITSDIPWNVKHMNSKVHAVLTEAIDDRIDEAYAGTNTMEIYHKLGKSCKDEFEGEIVGMADLLELAMYCKEEVSMGNNSLKSMLEKCVNLVKKNQVSVVLESSSPLFNAIMEALQDSNVDWNKNIDIN